MLVPLNFAYFAETLKSSPPSRERKRVSNFKGRSVIKTFFFVVFGGQAEESFPPSRTEESETKKGDHDFK